ncbi:ATP phosphoribosyltransferase regulatory subunit [Oceanobacillus luteolus]|uniref:ATP phosphoribosyltransferase regulatory subunit n=1 Tax=Oceanobacillus luteolus TaxID=1274358 RepID=A0ABW4HM80_9BACI|nr:ATP phosphoribosyltransferase regulatory subunit [Oceanobacillus luteolus]MCM3740495.1 ATP phosphoribosyltransferase regulatory subunit [Oceanobacillus luteolus]
MRNGIEKSSNRAVMNYKIKNQLIHKLKSRFSTYGYEQVHTPTFEDYDMYNSIQQTVNKDEMIKVIDRSGKVLVLRPDGTIPMTRLTVTDREINGSEQRLFYVFNVYRHPNGESTEKESTQAGVELFGNKKPEADAEVIALAVHTLKEIGFNNFKIEIGHAGFFKELIEQANLSPQDLQQLQELIQSKNMVEMEPFLTKLDLPSEIQEALYAIPLLYGSPSAVLEETKSIIQNERMQHILDNLLAVIEVLEDYDVLDFITLNLGLINNMDYYTDVIFQGFVENIGKPVLMGGRYDQLGKQFGKDMPAIGFAYEVDDLLEAINQHKLTDVRNEPAPLTLYYVAKQRRKALEAAQSLREQEYRVITKQLEIGTAEAGILFLEDKNVLIDETEQTFETTEELIRLVEKGGA